MAPSISRVCKYRAATSSATRLPEQAVSMVMLGPYFGMVSNSIAWCVNLARTCLDVQKVTESVTQYSASYADSDTGDSVVRIS